MAGDVNLYWNDYDDPNAAEIEIMVAEPESRRKGLGSEALILCMAYAYNDLGVTTFRAKIGESNEASQSLFFKLGYTCVGRSEVFKEIVLELRADSTQAAWQSVAGAAARLQRGQYDVD